jgi:hypothetical protein
VSKPKIGAPVRAPADRGDLPYDGKIVYIDATVHKNVHGVEYQWIHVKRCTTGTSHVWPSHRLGLAVDRDLVGPVALQPPDYLDAGGLDAPRPRG